MSPNQGSKAKKTNFLSPDNKQILGRRIENSSKVELSSNLKMSKNSVKFPSQVEYLIRENKSGSHDSDSTFFEKTSFSPPKITKMNLAKQMVQNKKSETKNHNLATMTSQKG